MTREKNIDVWPLFRKEHTVGLREPQLIQGRRSFPGGIYADVAMSPKIPYNHHGSSVPTWHHRTDDVASGSTGNGPDKPRGVKFWEVAFSVRPGQ